MIIRNVQVCPGHFATMSWPAYGHPSNYLFPIYPTEHYIALFSQHHICRLFQSAYPFLLVRRRRLLLHYILQASPVVQFALAQMH